MNMSTIRDEARFASFAGNKRNLRKMLNFLPNTTLSQSILARTEAICPVEDDDDDDDDDLSSSEEGSENEEDNFLVS